MRTGTPARGVLAATALAAGLTIAGCGSNVDEPEPSSLPTSHISSDKAAVRLLLEQINNN